MSETTNRGAPELLPDELLWAQGGHASDIALTALADGQHAVLPAELLAHVDGCSICTTHLGHAALLSIHTGAELQAARVAGERTERRPLPRLAIALGLAVAAVGVLPSVLDGSGDVQTFRAFLTRDVPLFLRGLGTLAWRLGEPGSAAGLLLTYGTGALLVLMGVVLVRILPKAQKETP